MGGTDRGRLSTMVTNEKGKWLNTQMLELSTAVAQQFSSPTPVASVQPYGDGNLNDTYLVTLAGYTAWR